MPTSALCLPLARRPLSMYIVTNIVVPLRMRSIGFLAVDLVDRLAI
jgi:hypothetical protein